MLIQELSNGLVVRNAPGYSWGLGGLLAPVGLVATVWALGIFEGGEALPALTRSVPAFTDPVPAR